MSLFSERRPPCWESFFQQPESAATEGQPSTHHGGESSRCGGPHHGPHHPHRCSRGDFNFGCRGRFPHHGHHGHHGHRGHHGPGGSDSDTERTHPFGSGPGGSGPWRHGGCFGRRGGHHHPYHHGSFRGCGRGRGVRIVPVPTHHSIPGLGDFLSQLAENMGNGFEEFLSAADRNARQTTDDKQIDFEPRADIFDTANEYIIHLSLPGANKSDINVEYDAEKSIVRVAGVVHRPEFSEELNASLVWNERRHEVGVFERQFRVVTDGSRPIDVDGDSMIAKMVDGVLIVRLKKAQAEQQQQRSTDGKKIVIDNDDDLYTADDAEEVKKQVDNHEEQDIETGKTVTNEKHASVIEVEDEMGSMRLSSETEAGDLMEEVEPTIYTPSEGSKEDAAEAEEYVKMDAEH